MTMLNGTTAVASRNASFHEGVMAKVMLSPFKLAFALALGTIAILLLAWTIDGVFVFEIWPQGVDRLRGLLADDLRNGVSFASQQGSSAGAITGPANFLYRVIFKATGVDDMGRQFADKAALSIPDTILRCAYVAQREAIEVTMVGTQLVGVRMATLARFAPLLLLLYAVGSVDGLVQRAIRGSCGGRESASLYHRAKYLQLVVFGLAGIALLVWPGSVDWGKYSAMLIAANSGIARMQWTYYKKHL